MTKKSLKEVGQNIYSAFDERCKENYGKSFADIIILVPEAGLQKKQSPEEKKQIRIINQRKTKQHIESKIIENDTDMHLSLRQSFTARNEQRLAQCFETKAEAMLRVNKSSPESKNRSHTLSTENVEGNLEQLLEDVKSWNDKEINWSKKAEEYGIRKKGSPENLKNGGQTLKAYLEAKGVDTTQFKTSHIKAFRNKEGN